MKKLDNRGFTLIEIVATTVILAIVMGVAIASYTNIVLESKREAFIAEANVHVRGIKQYIESEGIDVEDDNAVYYFDYKLVVDSSKSPFGEWKECYVVVTYDAESEKNTYYWTGLDKAGWGIKLQKVVDDFTQEDVVQNKFKRVDKGSSIDGRDNVVIIKAK